jgi:ATP-binding cassette, subfamily B, bacterial PglK
LDCASSAAIDWIVVVLTTIRQAFDLVGREHRGRWGLLIVLALIVSGFEMVGAALVYVLLALVIDPGSGIELPLLGDLNTTFRGVDETSLILGVVAAMALFFLMRGAVRVGATYVQSRIAHNAGARLSNQLVEGYLRWPYAVHLRRHSAELIRNGHHAVIEMVNQILLPVIRVVAETIMLMGMLIVLTLIAPAATVMAVIVIGGAAALLLLVIQPRLRRLGIVDHAEAGTTLAVLQQSLHGLRDIKMLGRERFFARAYGQSRLRMARARYLHATAWQLPPVVIETALLGFILLFFTVTLLRGAQAQGTLSILGLFAYAGLRLQPSLQHIIGGFNSLKYAAAPLQDVHADLVATRSVTAESDDVDPLPFEQSVRMDDVSFRYDGTDRDALFGVNLEIRPGEQIGLCGPTGGGKTTLVDLLTGLLEPTEGQVSVDGRDMRVHARRWQRNLGIVPQMVFLIDDTLRRNIALGIPDSEIDEVLLREAVRLAQLEAFIESLPEGLETTVGERGIRVSGGQRQRIAIARALYGRPSMLIFDEGTSALDNVTESHLMEAIERLRGTHTIVLVAHRLSTVQGADRIFLLSQGNLVASGSYDDLLRTSSAFRELAGG